MSSELPKRDRKAYMIGWRLRNREKINRQGRASYQRNIESRKARARDHYWENRQRELDRMRLKKYGITGDAFRAIVKKQGGKCAICSAVLEKTLCVDHNHTTGEVRGVICSSCNFAIGHSHDSPERLRAIADYLEKYE